MALILQCLFSATARIDAQNNCNEGDTGASSEPSLAQSRKKKLVATKLSSSSNPFVKHCVKLRLNCSYRRSCGSALLVGLTPIMEVRRFQELNNEPSNIECLLLLDGMERAEVSNLPSTSVVHVCPHVMKKLCGVQSVDSTEAVAVMKIPRSFYDMLGDQKEAVYPSWFPLPSRMLVLDGIQDPGNLGTLLRSAMAFKWPLQDAVFLLPGCCDPFNEKVLRAARGASFQTPIICGSWHHLEALTKPFRMKMLAAHPENHNNSSNRTRILTAELANSLLAGGPLCLVLGSEGFGLSNQALRSCELIAIAMAEVSESINVAVAGGIFMYMLQPQKIQLI